MKVTGVNQIMSAYHAQTSPAKKTEKSNATQGTDTFSLSPAAKDIQVARQALAQVPDIRQDKVDQIKAQLESGTYHVTGKEVAEKLFQRREESSWRV